ncbi:MAG: hypothetical protein M3O91_10820 [Chloroflexota bacterium]|nr:hypothetical protein [Chloroflexota bacterium]
MTRARLKFAQGEPIEFALDDIADYGPEITGFRAWVGAVFASPEGRWIIRFADDTLLGFRRDELKRARLMEGGVELTLGGDQPRDVAVREPDVVSYGPEPEGVRAWLGRVPHASGEAWLRLRDGHELRFKAGEGPHISFLEPAGRT